MRKLFFLLFVTTFFLGCNHAQDRTSGVKLKGMVNYPEAGLVLLEEYSDKELFTIDTITLESGGLFEHEVSVKEPGFYRLNFYNKQMVNLIISDQDLLIEVDGNAPGGAVQISGSKDMDLLMEVNQLVQEFQQKAGALNQQYAQANSQQDQETMTELRIMFEVETKKHKDQLKTKIRKMGNSLAVFQVVGNLSPEEDFHLLDSLGNIFAADPPDSKHTQRFLSYIDNVRLQMKNNEKLQLGKIAPDISLPNPDGEIVSLTSLRGKVVLVDFWAQWCRPCRVENPNIVAAYNQYKDKGFEVFGVSLDRTHEKWLQGIEEDGLTWTHVSDLKYWQSAAAKLYNINAIPASFLLDRDGKIIAKNLRGQALQAKLKEILG